MGHASQHQLAHRGLDERYAHRVEPFVMLAQAAILREPAEGAFHQPPQGQSPRNPSGRSAFQSMTSPMGGPNAPTR
jgi:hypothetical protein